MNGEYRGGGYKSHVIRVGGLRYGDYAYRQKAETLGFRCEWCAKGWVL